MNFVLLVLLVHLVASGIRALAGRLAASRGVSRWILLPMTATFVCMTAGGVSATSVAQERNPPDSATTRLSEPSNSPATELDDKKGPPAALLGRQLKPTRYNYDASKRLRFSRTSMATKGGETSRIWRAIEPDELKDLLGSGQYRPGPGNEGKYFFPTKAQAEVLAKEILPGRQFCITSGCIDSSVLGKIEKIYPAGEGQAWFIPNDLLPFIKNIVNHGRVG
jgi:hypothetical protein